MASPCFCQDPVPVLLVEDSEPVVAGAGHESVAVFVEGGAEDDLLVGVG